jgi:hypothetical protein
MRYPHVRLRTVAIAVVAIAALSFSAVASANPGQTQTVHFNSLVNQLGNPTGPTTNVSDCPAPILNDFTGINATGNGVMSETVNKNGDWSTSTFTGAATVDFYPAADAMFDSNGNLIMLMGTPDMTVTGHLTEWFGGSDNKQNVVFHGTVDFHGTVVGTGAPIKFHNAVHGAWLPGVDPNGPPSFYSNVASC